jgi:hypothetical protein
MLGYIKTMKANLAAKILSLALWGKPNRPHLPNTNTNTCSTGLAVLLLTAAFIAGCKTTPSVDWNNRIGTCTFNQAVAELGSPDKQSKLSDGRTVDQWITLHGSNKFPMGGGYASGNDGMGAGQTIVQSYKDHVLELTFGPDGKLLSVAKNY